MGGSAEAKGGAKAGFPRVKPSHPIVQSYSTVDKKDSMYEKSPNKHERSSTHGS